MDSSVQAHKHRRREEDKQAAKVPRCQSREEAQDRSQTMGAARPISPRALEPLYYDDDYVDGHEDDVRVDVGYVGDGYDVDDDDDDE